MIEKDFFISTNKNLMALIHRFEIHQLFINLLMLKGEIK